jgi:class 3 adenylate cyclase
MFSCDPKTNFALQRKIQGNVPRILIRQLISSFVLKYVLGNQKVDDKSSRDNCYRCLPSIQRFYGALLFVDVSGFTALAQKLTVDELRIQINTYFTQILNLLAKYGGDVVKFAGDALYVIWTVQKCEGELFSVNNLV